MILCNIALHDLAIHVKKLYTVFLINILHVGKPLDRNTYNSLYNLDVHCITI